MNHKQNQYRHFINRAWERLGLMLDRNDYDVIDKMIYNGQAKFLYHAKSTYSSVFRVNYKNLTFRVVFNPKTSKLVTVLENFKTFK